MSGKRKKNGAVCSKAPGKRQKQTSVFDYARAIDGSSVLNDTHATASSSRTSSRRSIAESSTSSTSSDSNAAQPTQNDAALVPYVSMPYQSYKFVDYQDLLLTESARRAHHYYRYADNPESFDPDSVCDDIWFCVLSLTHTEAVGARPNYAQSGGSRNGNQSNFSTASGRRRRPFNEDAPDGNAAFVGPRVQLTGVTPDGTTICVVVDDFEPYCYASIPEEWVDFCKNDLSCLQQLGLRWYTFMDEFFMRVVQHEPNFKRYRSCLKDGHVLLPLNEEERRCGVIRSDVKDIKGVYMDFTAVDSTTGETKPKHLTHYVIRLRVASPKLIPFVRQHLWYPQGVDGSTCALCGGNDPDSPRINSPFHPPSAAPDNYEDLLGEEYKYRERQVNWAKVVRDKCGCAARFHGQCLKMWARAQRLRGDLPADTQFVLRCPICTSDVITIAPCQWGFTRPKTSLPPMKQILLSEARAVSTAAAALNTNNSGWSNNSHYHSDNHARTSYNLQTEHAINPWDNNGGRGRMDNSVPTYGSVDLDIRALQDQQLETLYDERSTDMEMFQSYRSRSNSSGGHSLGASLRANGSGGSNSNGDGAYGSLGILGSSNSFGNEFNNRYSHEADVPQPLDDDHLPPWFDELEMDNADDTDDVGARSDGWNDQGNLYGWYGEFARLEYRNHRRYPPAPQPTEIQEVEAKLYAEQTRTLPYPSSMTVCDAKVGFVERFSVDRRVAPTQWFRIPCGQYVVIPPDDKQRTSIAAVEVQCSSAAVHRLEDQYGKKPPKDPTQDTPEWERARELYLLDVPPIIALIYDGEMSPDNGRFPHPHVNSTLQWGFLVHNMRTNHVVTVLMTLGQLSEPPKPARPDIECHIYSFDTEQELLRNVCMFSRVLRPSCHIQWNGNSFDIPWLYERARHLGLCCARDFGSRMRGKDLYWKSGQGASKRLITQVYMPGTICLDGMLFAQVERPTLGSYSLNFMGELLLDQRKVDLNHERIPELQQTAEGRAGLAEYLLGDIYLTWCNCTAMNMLPNLSQRSRYTYTTMQNLLQKGTQHRILNLLRHRSHQKTMNRCYGSSMNIMVLPCLRPARLDPVLLAQKGRKAEYDGAVVIEPSVGFYNQVVFTLDFGSLYPSLMYYYNLCLSTVLFPLVSQKHGVNMEQHAWQRPNHVFHQTRIEENKCDTNPIFVKHHVFRGVFPEILQWLKSKRKAVKNEMAAVENALISAKRNKQTHSPDGRTLAQLAARVKILDIIQNQIKLVMNSIYGFMGLHRTRGEVALPTTAETVTLMGQHAIHTARITAEQSFKRETGYNFSLGIVYGDTDSVFGRVVLDNTYETLALARNEYLIMEIGYLMAAATTKIFGGGLELQFEKIYHPFLLMGKKNYIGNKKEPNGSVKGDMKGIRAKRRDCCHMQRDATRVIEDRIIKNYNFKAAVDDVATILIRIQRYEEPLHRAVFSGSFNDQLLTPGRKMNAAARAMYKVWQRTGQVCQPGTRVLYIFAERPRLGKDLKDGTNTVIASAETLEYVQQHGLKYERSDYIIRVIKAVSPMMSHVAATEWGCTFDEAKSRLVAKWMAQVSRITICERASEMIGSNSNRLLFGKSVRIQPRCVQCKQVLHTTIEMDMESCGEHRKESETTSTALPKAICPKPQELRVERMAVVSLGFATQLRVKCADFKTLAQRCLSHPTVSNRWCVVEAPPAIIVPTKVWPPIVLTVQNTDVSQTITQLRISGPSLQNTMAKWISRQPHHGSSQSSTRLCDECKSHSQERAKDERRLIQEIRMQNWLAGQYWDKCRSCSAARMRSAGNVAECTTYICDVYSNTAHNTRMVSKLSKDLRERWVSDPTALEW